MKTLLPCLLFLSCFPAWAQPSPDGQASSRRMEVLGPAFSSHGPLSAHQSRVVFYRLQAAQPPGAVSVFVNGGYHTSLVSGGYSEMCFTPGDVEFAARPTGLRDPAQDPPQTLTTLRLQAGQVHYLRVRDLDGRLQLQPMGAAQALADLSGTRQQLHTLSRVAQGCTAEGRAADAPRLLVAPSPQPSAS